MQERKYYRENFKCNRIGLTMSDCPYKKRPEIKLGEKLFKTVDISERGVRIKSPYLLPYFTGEKVGVTISFFEFQLETEKREFKKIATIDLKGEITRISGDSISLYFYTQTDYITALIMRGQQICYRNCKYHSLKKATSKTHTSKNEWL